ncbi:MAG: phosphoribosylanthranilate isomerase [Oscillospiraceae bacterium]|nr:phosphoribosylanthranilate isomerase [Oscillospiraceae bacterium]
MTKIKLCGLSRQQDIEAANELKPEYIGFVFAPKSRRYVSRETAAALKGKLHPDIKAVGVFVNEEPETVAALLRDGIINIAQLHGTETEDYIRRLRTQTEKPIIKAFRIDTARDVLTAESSSADYILLDSGAGGTGTSFDWALIRHIHRPYFLAGGLGIGNVADAIRTLKPYAVDVSSGIETDGWKDKRKMQEFVTIIRKEEAK